MEDSGGGDVIGQSAAGSRAGNIHLYLYLCLCICICVFEIVTIMISPPLGIELETW